MKISKLHGRKRELRLSWEIIIAFKMYNVQIKSIVFQTKIDFSSKMFRFLYFILKHFILFQVKYPST